MIFARLLFISCFWLVAAAETHTWWFETGWVDANPDGEFPRKMVGFNGTWPLPTLRVKNGDRVEIYLINGLEDKNTSLHVHGIFQQGTNQMDGPQMVTQCPIPPGETFLYNFTIQDQVGCFWYHSHTPGQYGDGLRGVFIVEDDDFPYEYDQEVVLSIGDHYHNYSDELTAHFLSSANPSGSEPIPSNFLFNETRNVTWNVEPNTTYLLRIFNTGRFVSQYLWIEDHEFTVVEVDGIYVEKNTTDLLYITVGQRYSVLVTTKDCASRNYAFMNVADDTMLDTVPEDLVLNGTNYVVYNEKLPLPDQDRRDSLDDFLDDFYLTPLSQEKLLDDADYTITLDFQMAQLANGITYSFFNNISYTTPKVPPLLTALSAGNLSTNDLVYGTNTNSFVLQGGDVIDIVLNNMDGGPHPFHLHGHAFQLIERGPAGDEEPIKFNSSDHAEWPEYPLVRDTVYVNPMSYIVMRFKADNPGVWFFHCHIEWHLDQGLAMVLIEDPVAIQNNPSQQINDNHKQICEKGGIPWKGNAAGNDVNFLDLSGQNVQFGSFPNELRRVFAFARNVD